MTHPGMINEISNKDFERFEWSKKNFSQVKVIIEK